MIVPSLYNVVGLNHLLSLTMMFLHYEPCLPSQTDPELAQVLLGNDLNKLQQLLRERNRHKSEVRRQQDEELVSS